MPHSSQVLLLGLVKICQSFPANVMHVASQIHTIMSNVLECSLRFAVSLFALPSMHADRM